MPKARLVRALAQGDEPGPEVLDFLRIGHRIGDMRLAGAGKRRRPVDQRGALRRLRLVVQIDRQPVDLARKHRQVDGADRHELRLLAQSVDGAVEAVQALLDPPAKRAQGLAVVGQRRKLARQDRRRVGNAFDACVEMRRKRLRPFRAGGRHRHQMPGEVAAVHRRDVARQQRFERARVVPVEQVPPELAHPVDRRDGLLEAVDRSRRGRSSRSPVPRWSTGGRRRYWSATSCERPAEPGSPGSCRAECSCFPRWRTPRRSARSGAHTA